MQPPDDRPVPARIGIVGLGLIGGSIARGLANRAPSTRRVGVERPEVASAIEGTGLVDELRPGPADLGDCDLVILATPVPDSVRLIQALGTLRGPVVTDVGSTKREIMSAAETLAVPFVGGHPMAGGARGGYQQADPDLFAGRPWALVSSDTAGGREALRVVEAVLRVLGAIPVEMTADEHDRTVAYVSHLPQILSTALMNTVAESCGQRGLDLAGPGLVDMTRLAASPGVLWQGILESNQDNVRDALKQLRAALAATEEAVGTPELELMFSAANGHRRRVTDARAAGEPHALRSGEQDD